MRNQLKDLLGVPACRVGTSALQAADLQRRQKGLLTETVEFPAAAGNEDQGRREKDYAQSSDSSPSSGAVPGTILPELENWRDDGRIVARRSVMTINCPQCGSDVAPPDPPERKVACPNCRASFAVVSSAPPPGLSRSARGETTYTRKPAAEEDGPPPEERTRQRTRRSAAGLKLPSGKKYALTALDGPDRGRTFPVDKPRIVIGRSDADVMLSDPQVSRQHAALEFDEENVTLVDLNSRNGTRLHGERIDSSPLVNFGEFIIGDTTLVLMVTDSPSHVPPAED